MLLETSFTATVRLAVLVPAEAVSDAICADSSLRARISDAVINGMDVEAQVVIAMT